MPELVNFEVRDVHVLIDFSLEELKKIESALNNCEIYGVPQEEKKATDYLQNDFHPYISELVKRFTNEG